MWIESFAEYLCLLLQVIKLNSLCCFCRDFENSFAFVLCYFISDVYRSYLQVQ